MVPKSLASISTAAFLLPFFPPARSSFPTARAKQILEEKCSVCHEPAQAINADDGDPRVDVAERRVEAAARGRRQPRCHLVLGLRAWLPRPAGPATAKTAEWSSPGGPQSQPYGIAVINDVVWYSESGVEPNTLVRFDPATEKFQT